MSKKHFTTQAFFRLTNFFDLARSSGFVQRESRKFCPQNFVLALLKSVSSGSCSFHQIAGYLGQTSSFSLTRQALYYRIDSTCVAFLKAVTSRLLETQANALDLKKTAELRGIRRILVEDSSVQKIHPENATDFPGGSNHKGVSAGFKVNLVYDILTGNVLSQDLSSPTVQDKVLGRELFSFLEPGDVVMRDMGYFGMDYFKAIEGMGADWLSRLPVQVAVTLPSGKALEKFLRPLKNEVLDCEVTIGTKGQKCRLVGFRAPAQIAAKRRRARRTSKKQKRTPTQKSILRDGWFLYLTSVPKERLSANEIEKLYRSRWDIEIRFRAWKGSLNLSDALWRKSNKHHLKALIYAGLIHQLLMMHAGAKMLTIYKQQQISIEKLAKSVVLILTQLTDFTAEAEFSFDAREALREKRKRNLSIPQGIEGLT